MSQLNEFRDYFSKKNISEIAFLSENQPWFSVFDPCKLKMTFSDMLVFENPSVICLKNGCNALYFDRIKSVEYCENTTALGVLITIVCGSADDLDDNHTYVLVAS